MFSSFGGGGKNKPACSNMSPVAISLNPVRFPYNSYLNNCEMTQEGFKNILYFVAVNKGSQSYSSNKFILSNDHSTRSNFELGGIIVPQCGSFSITVTAIGLDCFKCCPFPSTNCSTIHSGIDSGRIFYQNIRTYSNKKFIGNPHEIIPINNLFLNFI